MGPQSGHEQDNHDRYWGERWSSTAPIGPDCVHIVPNALLPDKSREVRHPHPGVFPEVHYVPLGLTMAITRKLPSSKLMSLSRAAGLLHLHSGSYTKHMSVWQSGCRR